MIRDMPGYLNYILLCTIYYAAFSFLIDMPFLKKPFFDQVRLIHCLFFCGCYLAKWRFIEGEWRHNGDAVSFFRKLWFYIKTAIGKFFQ